MNLEHERVSQAPDVIEAALGTGALCFGDLGLPHRNDQSDGQADHHQQTGSDSRCVPPYEFVAAVSQRVTSSQHRQTLKVAAEIF
jgi:hypothetical protein